MSHWLDDVVGLLRSDTTDLRQLALMCRQDPTTFYVGANLDGVDLRGQDLRGLRLTNLAGARVLTDDRTRIDTPAEEAGSEDRPLFAILDDENMAQLDPNAVVAAFVDLGAEKTVAALVAPSPNATVASSPAAALGKRLTRGVHNGVIVDLADIAQTLGGAIESAERAAGRTVSGAVVALSSPDLDSIRCSARVSLGRKPIADDDLARAIAVALATLRQPNRTPLHVLPISWKVDSGRPLYDPRGLGGHVLGLDLLVVTQDARRAQALSHAMELAHLDLQGLVAAPFATALAALTPAELAGSTLCLDLGHHVTGVTVFRESSPVYIGAIPGAGLKITERLAGDLGVPIELATQAKLALANNGAESLELTHREATTVISGKALQESLQAVCHEIMTDVAARLDDRALATPDAVVLCGGSSALAALQYAAAEVFKTQVRVGTLNLSAAGSTSDITAMTAMGLVRRAFFGPREAISPRKLLGLSSRSSSPVGPPREGGLLARSSAWLRDNL